MEKFGFNKKVEKPVFSQEKGAATESPEVAAETSATPEKDARPAVPERFAHIVNAHWRERLRAVWKSRDIEMVEYFAENDSNPRVRRKAEARIAYHKQEVKEHILFLKSGAGREKSPFPAVPEKFAYIMNENVGARLEAVMESLDQELVNYLAINDPSRRVRMEAIWSAQIIPDTVKYLALNDLSWQVRVEAIESGLIIDPDIIERVALNDLDSHVRIVAINTEFLSQGVLEYIALNDRNWLARRAARRLLNKQAGQ